MPDPNEYKADGRDPYIDPISGVLKNIPQLDTESSLESFEKSMFQANFPQAVELAKNASVIDLNLWCAVHRICFSEVYAWAGETRSVRIEKGTTTFAYPETIQNESQRLFGQLNAALLQSTPDPDEIITLFGEINVLHPFREGNGRTQRIIFDAAFDKAGFIFDYSKLEQSSFIKALIHAYHDDPKMLLALFRPIITAK